MKNIIYIQIYKGENQYVAEGMNLPVVTQGKDLDEVVKNIKEAIELHLETEDRATYDFSEHPQILVNFELPTPMYA
jgi:predicted RNase H-like HicB family nuclease